MYNIYIYNNIIYIYIYVYIYVYIYIYHHIHTYYTSITASRHIIILLYLIYQYIDPFDPLIIID